MLWLVNPDDYAEILHAWLDGTPLADNDRYYVFARSAFGELIAWGENTGVSLKIQTCHGMIYPTDDSAKLKRRGPDFTIDGFFASISKKSLDIIDENEEYLFERALQKLGPLKVDEMYGFVPALALGGSQRLEGLQVVKVIEHVSFLADLGEKQVMADIVAMSRALRAND